MQVGDAYGGRAHIDTAAVLPEIERRADDGDVGAWHVPVLLHCTDGVRGQSGSRKTISGDPAPNPGTGAKKPTPSRPGARWKWSAFHAIAELVEFPDHPRCACAFGLGTYRRTPLLVAHPLVQNQPKQSAKPMGNGPDGLLVSQARQQPVKCQFKYAPFDLYRRLSRLIEQPPNPTIPLRRARAVRLPLRSLRSPDTLPPTRTVPSPNRKSLPGDPLRRSSVAPNPTRNRALPPRVAQRPDAPALGPWLPAPTSRCASRSTPTPPAPCSAADGKLHSVPRRRPARRPIAPAWPAAGNRPAPPARPGRFPRPPAPSACVAH